MIARFGSFVTMFLILATLALAGCTVSPVLDTRIPANLAIVEARRSLPAVVPAEEVGEILPDPVPAPPCIVIKVNRSKDGAFVYHMPDGAYYDQVRIDESRGEFFACDEQEAINAGARKASR